MTAQATWFCSESSDWGTGTIGILEAFAGPGLLTWPLLLLSPIRADPAPTTEDAAIICCC